MTKRKPADKVPIAVRLPEALRKRIEVAAEKGQTSMNNEMIRRLERSFFGEWMEERLQNMAQETAKSFAQEINERITSLMQTYNLEITRANERLAQVEHVQRLQEMLFTKGDANG